MVKAKDEGQDPGFTAFKESPGVWGVERLGGSNGNWGDPPRLVESRRKDVPYNRKGSGPHVGRESEAAVVPLEIKDNTTLVKGRAATSSMRFQEGKDR